MPGLISRAYVGSFASAIRPVFSAPVLDPVRDSVAALEAWFAQWLRNPAHIEALVAHRERFAARRRVEEPGWQPPAEYVAPEAESFFKGMAPMPPYSRRVRRQRKSEGNRTDGTKGTDGASRAPVEPMQTAGRDRHEKPMKGNTTAKIQERNRVLGARLRVAREKAGWTKWGAGKELCARVKCSPSRLANLEEGHASEPLLRAVAAELKISMTWLETGLGEMFDEQPPAPPVREQVESRKSKVEGLDASARSAGDDGDDLAAAAAALKEAKRVLAQAQEAHDAARARVLKLVEAEG